MKLIFILIFFFIRFNSFPQGDVFALTANPDDPTEIGLYTCEAFNCLGRVYSSSKVHVVGRGSREGSLKPADNMLHTGPPPIFTEELKDLKIKVGDPITLSCQGENVLYTNFFFVCSVRYRLFFFTLKYK